MLLQVKNPFLQVGSYAKDKHRTINPLRGFTTPLQTYTKALDLNLQILKSKYPFKQEIQLRELLEELENDVGTVINIIEEEKAEIEKSNSHQVLEVQEYFEEGKGKMETQEKEKEISMGELKMELESGKEAVESENKLLKRSFLKLYYKFEKARKELMVKEQELHAAKIQVQKFRTASQLLLEDRFKQENDDDEPSNTYIY